jgi:hypothetical protein
MMGSTDGIPGIVDHHTCTVDLLAVCMKQNIWSRPDPIQKISEHG